MNYIKKSFGYYALKILFICLISISVYGIKVDSLINLSQNSHDTTKMRLFFEIGWEYRGNDPQKCISYISDCIKLSEKFNNQKQKSDCISAMGDINIRLGKYELAMTYYKEALAIKKDINDSIRISGLLGAIADCYGYLGDVEKSNEYYDKSLEIAKKIKNKKLEATVNANMAFNFYYNGKFDIALQYFLNSLKIFEDLNDTRNIAQMTINISAVYNELDNIELTKKYLFKAKEQIIKLNDKRMLASCYINLGTVYFLEKDIKSALEYCNNSIKLNEEIENLRGLGDGYNLLGVIYRQQEKYKEALDIDLKNLELRIKLNDKSALTESYIKLGISYQKVKMFDKSIEFLNKGLDLAINQDYKTRIIEIYRELSNTFYNKKDYKMAYDYYERYSIQKDSLLNTDMNNQIAEMQTKYETEKKQKEIELLNKDKIISDAELKKQTIIRNSFIIGFVFILLIVLILYNRYIIKKKANTQLSLQNQLIMQQKEEIETQRDEILDKNEILEIQKSEIMRKHDENQEQKKEILDSIHYAKRIQETMLPDLSSTFQIPNSKLQEEEESEKVSRRESEYQQQLSSKSQIPNSKLQEEESNQYSVNCNQTSVGNSQSTIIGSQFATSTSNFKLQTSNFFILFKPKDIVSGDFYWAKVVNDTLVYCVADCTGHGVPGAFMSMLGIAFLNEIINKYQIEPSKKLQPSDILDNLREMVISSLHQTGKTGEQKDGMDISLVAIKLKEPNSNLQIPNSKSQETRKEESEKVRLGEGETASANNQSSINNNQSCHVQWAGANNPLWIVRGVTQSSGLLVEPEVRNTDFQNLKNLENLEEHTSQRLVLQEVKPDKMPIGIYYEENKPFTNHEFNLSKGDTIYIFSDGFADQFGGPEGKKFKYSQFKNIILDMNINHIEDQKYILDYAFELWKGDNMQLDDICVIGLKL